MLAEKTSYSNPAKLMNYLKAKKARENGTFSDVNEYVSYVDAYAKTSTRWTQNEVLNKQPTVAKLLPHK